jgi:hypothetical protein
MTALPLPPLKLSRLQRKIGLQLMDYMSVRPYPLDMSGWVKPGIGLMVERMLGEIAGIRIDITDVLPERDGVVERFVPPIPRPTRTTPVALARIPRTIRRYNPVRWTEDVRYQQFVQAFHELAALDPGTLSWAELFQVVRRTLVATDLITDLRLDYLPRTGYDLLRCAWHLRCLACLTSSGCSLPAPEPAPETPTARGAGNSSPSRSGAAGRLHPARSADPEEAAGRRAPVRQLPPGLG